MYMYIYVYIYIYVCIFIYLYIWMYVYIYTVLGTLARCESIYVDTLYIYSQLDILWGGYGE